MTNRLYYGDNLEVLRNGIETEFGRFPALQIVTLAERMMGIRPKLPPLLSPVKKAARVETRASHQPGAQKTLL